MAPKGLGGYVGRTEEFAKVERVIKDAEARMRAMELGVISLNKEIDNLAQLERVILENIKCLKEKRIIAIAIEYRKAKEDLRRLQLKLSVARTEKERGSKILADTKAILTQAMNEKEKLLNTDNVIDFPGKKNG